VTTTAILSALIEEQQGLLTQLQGARKVARAGRNFWLGQLNGHSVVLALSRIGKVGAATTATTLIEHFGADRIVFTGVAGGLGDAVCVGDVVVATGFVQHDMDASPLFPKYQIPLTGRSCLACDIELSALVFEAVNLMLAGGRGLFEQSSGGRAPLMHAGLIATGDRFVASALEAATLKTALKSAGFDALAVEMEGAAVAQVCFDYGVPFAAVRTISDRADDTAHLDFPEFVVKVASRYSQHMIGAFLNLLPKT
jgi:adenosylhomocysteine nucleosidase